MDVLWHQDVAEDIELMSATETFEASLEGDSELVVVEKRLAAITTEGQEMEMTGVLVSLEVVRHGGILGWIPPMAKCKPWVGHPAPGYAKDDKVCGIFD
jgi:nitrogenase molybdenum-iron protein alpha/beta subunit